MSMYKLIKKYRINSDLIGPYKILSLTILTATLTISQMSISAMAVASELGTDIKPMLGKPAPADFNTVIMTDGTGLPSGSGSVVKGKAIYELKCASCHGIDGKQAGNELVGGQGSLTSMRPLKTVGSYWPYITTLYDYITRAMPYNQEKSLSADEVYAVSAYVLFLNEIVNEGAVLNQDNLADITMPNREGFVIGEMP